MEGPDFTPPTVTRYAPPEQGRERPFANQPIDILVKVARFKRLQQTGGTFKMESMLVLDAQVVMVHPAGRSCQQLVECPARGHRGGRIQMNCEIVFELVESRVHPRNL